MTFWRDIQGGGELIEGFVEVVHLHQNADNNYNREDVSGGTDTATTTRVWYGGSLAAGYEFMADGGFFVRPMLGSSLARDGSRGGTFQLAIGYKLF